MTRNLNTVKNIRYLFPAIILAIAAVFAGIWFNSQKSKINVATILTQPRNIESFHLISKSGKPFTNKNLQGRWSLIFFGFTHCPHICPTTLVTLNKTYQQLEKDHVKNMPQIIFISVDPARDSPKVITNYLSNFNNKFQGATGTKKQIDALTKDFSVVYMKTGNNVDHSGAILITNPNGQLYGIFSSPHDPKTIAKDIETIIG